ncbi:winged helix-turn-helix domain-containing protein [Bacillus carboniphilus]|uniref:Winged helix-turn-helix domain-containing protein n=1 Tax=Bacillus carboniphilus TaxID=86663 RepID=A0ABY9JQ65_9BACI|nr:winged helix-turn-helix domain-containing protein [Bacillus carboniphilus]WLR41544.1 winged helix-turn-helix domain-containing protein [Bacillus carboniphilus]
MSSNFNGQINHTIKELLADGQEHSRKEIIEYIIEKFNNKDVTKELCSSRLSELIVTREITIVERGIYKLTPETITLHEECIDTLTNAILGLQRTANKINILSISDEEQKTLEKIKLSISHIKDDIKTFDEV